MRTIKLLIEYDGTDFNGWQRQASPRRTVQAEIEKALQKIFGRKIILYGAGRTDSGVHALGQNAHFLSSSAMPVEKIVRALNGNLPPDIAIIEAEEAPAGFHAQYDARTKIYRYTIINRAERNACYRRYVLHVPQKLNLTRMRQGSRDLIGQKDFRSFQASDPAVLKKGKRRSSVRRIKRIDFKKRGDMIFIEIEADGFLYKMVRNIVGALLEIGLGHLRTDSIRRILKQKDRSASPPTAKPQGLCLVEVKYGPPQMTHK